MMRMQRITVLYPENLKAIDERWFVQWLVSKFKGSFKVDESSDIQFSVESLKNGKN